MDQLNTTPLLVIGYSIGVALLSELLAYVFIYRTARFKRLKSSFEKYVPNPDGAASTSSVKGSKTSKKKEAKNKSFEDDAGKKMAVIQVFTGIITFATMILSFKILPQLFGNETVGTLPFEPPGFLRKITQRGLDGGAAREFSPFFIFMLCQGSVRVIIGKLMPFGPTRKMLNFKPDMEKIFKSE